jgi:putative selenate reductase
MAAMQKFDKAHDVITRTNPFPRMTGMVCDHLCQYKCTRVNYDDPVQIREVKRFIAEHGNGKRAEPYQNNASKAAIIGAGPSGLSCAYFLRKAGFEVTIYEEKDRPGGMVSGAIPSFRLTDEAMSKDIAQIEETGVRIHFNKKVDKEAFEQLNKDNAFIYISSGAQRSVKLDLENSRANGVLDPLSFLINVKKGIPVKVGQTVLIIGGGNTAMDAARTARRLVGENGTVSIIYRRTKKQMPADLGEIKAVLDEDMKIMELVSPVKINTTNGHVTSVTCQKMKLGGEDESGRPGPVAVPGSTFEIPCDTIIPAIGQELAIDFLSADKLLTGQDSYETQIPGIFIGGDAMRGASTAINAIGDGRKAAAEIIQNARLAADVPAAKNALRISLREHMINRARRKYSGNHDSKSKDAPLGFDLIGQTFSEKEAVKEASRCLLCDEVCNICTTVCPNLALYHFQINPEDRLSIPNKPHPNDMFKVAGQSIQILHIADWCNECGNCTTFCPASDAPFKQKPHLYLDRDSFEQEKDGYFFTSDGGAYILHKLKDNRAAILKKNGNGISYSGHDVAFGFDHQNELTDTPPISFENHKYNLEEAAGMKVILEGAASFFGLKTYYE